MSALFFVPFRTWHLKWIAGPAAAAWQETAEKFPALARDYEVAALAWTAIRAGGIDDRGVEADELGGEPVAAAGIRPEFAEDQSGRGISGECWTLFDPPVKPGGGLSRDEWRDVLAMMRTVLAAAERRGYRRLTAYVRPDLPFGFKLARRLGFEVEGLLRRWGPMDADTLMMARVTPRSAAKKEAA